METIINGKKIIFNDDQVNAVNTIKTFLADKDKFFASVEGPAGSGKSTLVKVSIQGLSQVAVTAPTHKAKKVVERFTGRKAETLHSLLGLRPDMSLEEFDKNNVLFASLGKEKMSQYKYLVIDESSMVNHDLLDLIKKTARLYKVKVFCLGDPFQLTPVKKKDDEETAELSPIFTDPDFLHITLTKVERQQDSNPLMYVYDAIRSDIHSNRDLFQRETILKGNEGIIFYEQQPLEFGQAALDIFSSTAYKEDANYGKILCWQNDTVRRWNNYMRMNLFGDLRDDLKPGEILMSYTNIYDEEMFMELKLQNSAEYCIKDVQLDVNQGIKGWRVTLQDIDSINKLPVELFIVFPDQANYIKFLSMEQPKAEAARKAPKDKRGWYWKQYYTFKNQFLLMEKLVDGYDQLLCKKDIDFAYALTVHKSQGSTYNQVFLDESDINHNPDPSERNRLKYVGLTRPTNIAHVVRYG